LSHRISARCKITDRNYLLDALDALGWKHSASCVNDTITLGNSMSLVQNRDGTWQVTGDPYYEMGALRDYYNNTSKLIADLQTHYNNFMARDKLESMGFYLTDEEETQEEIVLTFDNGM
jgi:hypothetical protein